MTLRTIIKELVENLRSLRLALVLFLLLAAAAAVGTFLPQDPAGPGYYRSLPFRGLLGLLCLNMAACLWSRREGPATAASGRRLRPLLSLAGHLALLLTFGSALAGSLWGRTATQNVHVGDALRAAYDWSEKAERPLPFELRVLALAREPYPAALKVGARVAATGEKKALVTTHAGGSFALPGVPGTFTLKKFDPGGGSWSFAWKDGGEGERIIGKGEEIPGTGLTLVVVAFKEFAEEKMLGAEVEAVIGGRVLARRVVSPNRPLRLGETDVFLTATGRDQEGDPFVGFQMVTDPFRPWALGWGTLFLLASWGALLLRMRERRG